MLYQLSYALEPHFQGSILGGAGVGQAWLWQGSAVIVVDIGHGRERGTSEVWNWALESDSLSFPSMSPEAGIGRLLCEPTAERIRQLARRIHRVSHLSRTVVSLTWYLGQSTLKSIAWTILHK